MLKKLMDPETTWRLWRKAFDTWEATTADHLETWLKSPVVLAPSGTALKFYMNARSQRERWLAQYYAALGIPTRRDQERTLHALNQLQSRLLDLEEQIADLQDEVDPVEPEQGVGSQ